ncbi:non-ribosomal peptide synthetase [Streptomyces sp. NPDC007901]|uniref:non-ribosomal peptide synthetase n=1 Tax=Streptomyces sp. NPDC007901 TaxID=3364785 RepID=UPI0036EB4E03
MEPTTSRAVRSTADKGSHALIRRLSAGDDIGTLRGRLGTASERQPELAGLRLWDEPVAAGADDPAAEERRIREIGRSVVGVARLTVLTYADGAADLLIVAHRDRLGRSGLGALADLAQGADVTVAFPAGPGPRPGPAAWGLGEPTGRGEPLRVPVPVTRARAGDAKQAAAVARDAVAATLAHYRLADSAAFTVLVDDTVSCHTARNPADDEDAPALGALALTVGTAEDGTDPAVGVFVAEQGQDRYVPFTAAPFPVTVTVEVTPERGLAAVLTTGDSVMAPVVAAQFAHVLGALLDAYALGTTDAALDEAARLPEATAAEIVGRGRTAGRTGFRPTTVPAAFADLARTQPDAPAVSDHATTLTYGELAERGGRIAAGLRERGVRPGDHVAVCLGRDVDTVATMLGVMMAGAAYVPVDPAYPAERLAYTAADAAVKAVVTAAADDEAFPDHPTVTTAELLASSPADTADTAGGAGTPGGSDTADGASTPAESDTADGAATPAGSDTAAASDPAGIAYVIYTSGSTGRPKGVAVPHANVAALVDATRTDMSLGPSDVWSFVHSSAFDFSVWEIWGCLLTGGHLVVVGADTARSPEDFHDLLAARGVTVLSQTPAAFAALQEADARKGTALAVRLVVFGGEPLDVRMLQGWFRRHPATRCRLVNMFGITETTVHVTAQTVTPGDVTAVSRSVGRALPGWSVSVRDRRGAVLPYGVPGEIWVGGAGLADRYLNQPELTAARFVDDPVTGSRQYRSGDLGRLAPDGRLDHLGRIDSQVKLRGFRIELDEIRSVLLADPGVTAAAVTVHQAVAGDSATARLEAYVVVNGDRGVDDIRRRMASYLPAYMVPSTLAPIAALPLTINGKVDSARLRELVSSAPEPAAGPAPAGTGTGTGTILSQVLSAWSEVLGEAAEPDDDFFEGGGNSLLAVRLSGALRRAGLPAISLRELYVHATPTELAELFARRTQDASA